ncbi:hypothetical protein PBAL39_25435 [Pedobacter sp. BAL39]|uniref:tetratricopeptide repeat protein n=1 Tax=Pedobacter sp. BAL39 TaxID=391596 RepID=UPI000155950D|nr:tetratricopeptide repeat protein [Pedobacter sp. BAL39]EDM36673.1 hypothetical protein PBAL39_25435 [Pedobacter sp. BAL39]
MSEKELSQEILDQIAALSESGNEYMDEDDFDAAVSMWEEALELIPDPQNTYAESVWLNASIGDAWFLQDDYESALAYFLLAKSNIEENTYQNPFIMLRLGQCYLEAGDTDLAKEFLLRAYMLDGESVFEGEDDKYLTFLKTYVDLSPQP